MWIIMKNFKKDVKFLKKPWIKNHCISRSLYFCFVVSVQSIWKAFFEKKLSTLYPDSRRKRLKVKTMKVIVQELISGFLGRKLLELFVKFYHLSFRIWLLYLFIVED